MQLSFDKTEVFKHVWIGFQIEFYIKSIEHRVFAVSERSLYNVENIILWSKTRTCNLLTKIIKSRKAQ